MSKEIKQLFTRRTLAQIPVFYRYLTEFETLELGELKVHARFSSCKSHFSNAYLNFGLHKPVTNINIIDYLEFNHSIDHE